MLEIKQVTNDAYQKQRLILPDGSAVILIIRFVPMQYGWFITEITHNDFTLNGVRVCNSPNILHQYRNKIPFGLSCFSKDNREPTLQQDFSSGASKLYLLTEAEVQAYTEYLTGG